MAGIAAGLANEGYHVFIYSIANFPLARCLEQIRNDICYHNLSVTIVAVGGGLSYGNLGYSHHATELLHTIHCGFEFHTGDPAEVLAVMKAIHNYSGPSYLRLGKAGEVVFHNKEPIINAGELVVIEEGKGVLLITVGGVLDLGFEIKKMLKPHKIEAAISSLPEIAPLSSESFRLMKESYELVVVIEEHRNGGVYSYLSDCLHVHEITDGIKSPIFLITIEILSRFFRWFGFLRSKFNLSPDACTSKIVSTSSV